MVGKEAHMNNEIQVSVRGFAGGEATLYQSEGKTPYCTFRVGASWMRGSGESRESVTEWFTVKTYAELANNCAVSIQKGTPVLVRGRLETETYASKDEPSHVRTALVIRADSVGIELGRGSAQYFKTPLPAEESASA